MTRRQLKAELRDARQLLAMVIEYDPRERATRMIDKALAGEVRPHRQLLMCLHCGQRTGMDVSFTEGRDPEPFLNYHLRGLRYGCARPVQHRAFVEFIAQQLGGDDADLYSDDDDD